MKSEECAVHECEYRQIVGVLIQIDYWSVNTERLLECEYRDFVGRVMSVEEYGEYSGEGEEEGPGIIRDLR